MGFADSLLQNCLNAAYPGRYAYCTYTNASGADNMSILYYNQQKLGFVNILCSYSNITDFNTYKLYYKSPDLATTHDSIFLYVTLNHTNSGTASSDINSREQQIAGEMGQIEGHFSSLPNMINMGDFNTHTSTEACYQTLVAPSNLAYRYYDPPFYPDGAYSYPADWDASPSTYASSLTVSTRENSGDPNSCSGNTGGAYSWYDHIFLSAKIVNSADHISYIPHSFRVIGNDGHRLGISANSSPANTSVPSNIADNIFQVSEHYPVSLDLLVNLSDASVVSMPAAEEKISVVNPAGEQLIMHFSKDLEGKTIYITCTDVLGRQQIKTSIPSAHESAQIPFALYPGIYFLNFRTNGQAIYQTTILKK
jgi:hypothetical protein